MLYQIYEVHGLVTKKLSWVGGGGGWGGKKDDK